MSLWVDDRSQGGSCFNAGQSVVRNNRLANSVQTHVFDSGSAAAVGGQERTGPTLFARLDKGEEGEKLREQRLRAESARGEEALTVSHDCFACWLIYHAARTRLRRDCAHVQPKRNLQGVSCAPEGAQHDRSVQNVSSTCGQRPQMQRLGTCTERCTVQNASSVFEQRTRRARARMTLKPRSFGSEVGNAEFGLRRWPRCGGE